MDIPYQANSKYSFLIQRNTDKDVQVHLQLEQLRQQYNDHNFLLQNDVQLQQHQKQEVNTINENHQLIHYSSHSISQNKRKIISRFDGHIFNSSHNGQYGNIY